MKDQNFFPFEVCDDTPFIGVFMQQKPDDMIWYEYDCYVMSKTKIRFIVYDMKDSFHGGRGSRINEFVAIVKPEVTKSAIEKEAFKVASIQRTDELEKSEQKIIQSYAAKILKGLN